MLGGLFAAVIVALLMAGCLAAIIAMHAFRQQRDHLARGEKANGQGDTMPPLEARSSAFLHPTSIAQGRQRNHG